MRSSAGLVLFVLAFLPVATSAALAATAAAPPAGTAAPNAVLLREAAVVCGSGGCYTPQTKHQAKRKLVPLGHG
jgi:hypothetical protein